ARLRLRRRAPFMRRWLHVRSTRLALEAHARVALVARGAVPLEGVGDLAGDLDDRERALDANGADVAAGDVATPARDREQAARLRALALADRHAERDPAAIAI